MSAVTIPCTPDRLVSANVRVHWARRAALQDLVERKLKAKGRKIVAEDQVPADAAGTNVIDLMAALKRSLEKSEPAPAKARPAAARKTSRKR